VFENGAFYLWTTAEVTHLLGQETASKVVRVFGLKEAEQNRLALAEERFMAETYDELATPLQKLLDVRQKRPAPFREVPIAASNGLMISALARAAAAFGEHRYAEAAGNAGHVLATELWNPKKKTLLRTASGTPALAQDYAFVIQGMLDLFDVTWDPRWLDLAVAMQQRQDELFWNASAGRYQTGRSVPEAVAGLSRDTTTNAASAVNLLRLAALRGDAAWRERPQMIFESHAGSIAQDGASFVSLAAAYETSLRAPAIEVVVGNISTKATFDVVRAIQERWQPMRAVVVVPAKGYGRDRMLKALPFLGGLAGDPKSPVHYECTKGECRRR
jgi:uncharacterized protein YyaL (SSP411 family)